MQRAQLFGQRRRGSDTIFLDFLQLAVDLRERFLERLHEILDRLVTAIEIKLRGLLELGERRLCEIEKRLVVVAQGIRGERGERLAQFLFSVFEEGELVGCGAPLGGKFRFKPCAGRCELGAEL